MIELCNINAGYGEKKILKDISAVFPTGQITTLVGPNGCGKSTLIKVVAGLLQATSGNVQIDEISLLDYSRKEKAKKISYLPQSRNVPDITVRRMVLHGRFPYLDYPRRYRATDYAIAEQAMRDVGVDDLADCHMGELSGGQRQRVYLAMVFCQQTDIVLLDEPTTYLDLQHQLEIIAFAKQLKESGKTVVLVVHDINLALQCADQLVILNDGKLVQVGTPSAIVQSGEIESVFSIKTQPIYCEDGTIQYLFSLPK